MPRYIIQKAAEPESYGDAYTSALDTLLGSEELVADTPQGPLKVREMPAEVEQEQLAELERRPHIRYVEPDVEDRALLADGVDGSALEYHEIDRAPVAEGMLVGVGDTGAPSGHPAVRVKETWTWFSDDGMDRNGHGSWVAGAALATGAWLVSGKVLGDDGSGSRSGVIAFIRRFADYCAEQGKPGACSLSLGGPGFSQAYEDAISYALSKGVITVCAAGNGGREGEPVNAPANSPSAVAVAALDHRTGAIADFSCRGPEINIAAAGVRLQGLGLNGSTATLSGTSMATPLVARALAHLLSVDRDPRKAIQALYAGALDTSHPATSEGNGTLRAHHALTKLAPAPEEPKDYYPGVPRCTFSDWCRRGAYKKEHVVTFGRDYVEVGHWQPKEGVFK
jgi:subtilisin family serine protease